MNANSASTSALDPANIEALLKPMQMHVNKSVVVTYVGINK